ncbi:MAG: M3 family oligoendopeptidase [Anaerolineales bacterium]|nr:M3 family oligoendopeptidase [Anaerolineales bacterium]RLC96428.1 MAG: oligoendopeptidase F [Chloroflexota bacterium]
MTAAYKQERWSLNALFPGHESPEYADAMKKLEGSIESFEKLRPELDLEIDEKDFLKIVTELEEITKQSNRLYGFAGLWFTEDTQDQDAQALQARIEQFLVGLQNKTLFFSLWWKELDQATADQLMAASGDLKYWLEEMRHYTPHTLTEPEEKILNIKNVTGFSALITLYDSITNRYSFKVDIDGEEKDLTRGELMVYARHHDPKLRSAIYQELYKVYADDGPILGQIYQTVARDWANENIDLRKYNNPISVRNLRNDVPDKAVDVLLDVCQKNAPVFQRFFDLKARWLKTEQLRRYDIYAPVVAQADKTYTFQEGVDMVLDAFQTFDPRVAQLAEKIIADGHVDSEVRKGKRGGAFCWSVDKDLSPWVLLNFQGTADSVATMAHELGHGIHALLAADHSVFTYHSSLPLAENASTFGEMLLIDKLLSEEKDPAVRRDILFKQVDDAYATIMRQSFFALFEREAHKMIKDGAIIDDLSEMYMENLKKQFGKAVSISDEFRWEWVSIPHFYHTPFYVYAYAFGQLLVLSLYQRYQKEGDSFKPGYIKILEAGGSKAPAAILAESGIDIASQDFWQGGFDVIGGMVKELEDLPIE